MPQELILHHYPTSPYSEKVRLALGLKGLAWRSLEVGAVLPRPYTAPLTGGFRRIPILQIGADVYCDTQVIASELDRRFPQPSLFPAASEGMARMLGGWSDSRFFNAAMMVTLGGLGDDLPEAFIVDREAMAGSRFNIRRMREALAPMREQMRAQLGWIDSHLADGRSFVFGETPGWADINVYFNCWFLRHNCPRQAGLLDGFAHLPAWESRVAAIGHGAPTPIAGDEALAIAAAAQPESQACADPNEPNGLRPGEQVAVAADDYARDAVVGALVSSCAQHVALRLEHARVGATVAHFPRAGYNVTRAA